MHAFCCQKYYLWAIIGNKKTKTILAWHHLVWFTFDWPWRTIGCKASRLAVGNFSLTVSTDLVWSTALFSHQIQQWTAVINKCRETEARCPLGKLLWSRQQTGHSHQYRPLAIDRLYWSGWAVGPGEGKACWISSEQLFRVTDKFNCLSGSDHGNKRLLSTRGLYPVVAVTQYYSRFGRASGVVCAHSHIS